MLRWFQVYKALLHSTHPAFPITLTKTETHALNTNKSFSNYVVEQNLAAPIASQYFHNFYVLIFKQILADEQASKAWEHSN
jgi:hypothetical protein